LTTRTIAPSYIIVDGRHLVYGACIQIRKHLWKAGHSRSGILLAERRLANTFLDRSFSKGHLTPRSYITPSYSRMSRPLYSRKSRRPYITLSYSRTSHCRAAENHIIHTSNHHIVESHVVCTSHHCTVGHHAVMQLKIMPLYSRMSHLLYSRKSHCRAVVYLLVMQ